MVTEWLPSEGWLSQKVPVTVGMDGGYAATSSPQ